MHQIGDYLYGPNFIADLHFERPAPEGGGTCVRVWNITGSLVQQGQNGGQMPPTFYDLRGNEAIAFRRRVGELSNTGGLIELLAHGAADEAPTSTANRTTKSRAVAAGSRR